MINGNYGLRAPAVPRPKPRTGKRVRPGDAVRRLKPTWYGSGDTGLVSRRRWWLWLTVHWTNGHVTTVPARSVRRIVGYRRGED